MIKAKAHTLLLFVGLLITGITLAQNKNPKLDNSLLWEISGNGLTKSSYLFGTQHIMCEQDFEIKEKVKTAFSKCEKLGLELDFDDPIELQNMMKLMNAPEPLSQTLTKEQYKELDSILQTKIGASASEYENYSLLGIMSAVMSKSLNCTQKVYELEFFKMAMAGHKEIIGMEKVQDQIDAFGNTYTNQEIIDQLKQFDNSYLNKLTELYKKEKLNAMYKMISEDEYLNEKNQESMLDNRNKNWVKKLPELLKNNSLFIAVGAGHLAGSNGLIQLLRNQGYAVTAVK